MATKQKSKRCKNCETKTLHQKEYLSFPVGLLISVLTVGLFLPIWGFVMFGDMFKRYRCQRCGS